MSLVVASAVALHHRLATTDLSLAPGEMVALVGPNGGGKTSLLRALARVEGAAGRVLVVGESLDAMSAARRRLAVALLPASRELHWPIPVRDAIALGLKRPDAARIDELVGLLELDTFADRAVTSLSTGERARVLLARALAARPRLLLLDEPFANLEPYWVIRTAEIIRDCANDGAAVVVALHDLDQLDAFDRALLIAKGAVQVDDTPTRLIADARFEQFFRIRRNSGGWTIRPEGRQSSP